MTDEQAMTDAALRKVVVELLKRRAQRIERIESNTRIDAESAATRMSKSLEIVKWCIVSISAVMVTTLLIGLLVLFQVVGEAKRIEREIVAIQQEVVRIYDTLTNPFQAMGGSLGRQIDRSLGLGSARISSSDIRSASDGPEMKASGDVHNQD